MPKIMTAASFAKRMRRVVTSACKNASNSCSTEFDSKWGIVLPAPGTGSVSAHLQELFSDCDIAIVDVTIMDSLYSLGIIDAQNKPVILIASEENSIPHIFADRRLIIYDNSDPEGTLVPRLTDALIAVHNHPDSFILSKEKETSSKQIPRAFISYSHADQKCLMRLLLHLRPLERDQHIKVWADTLLIAGDCWEERIKEELSQAAIAVLLISADFLASEFITRKELPSLLSAAQDRGTVILPFIVGPCRFLKDPVLSRYQALNNPSMPLLKLSPVEQDELYVKLVDRIENAIHSWNAT